MKNPTYLAAKTIVWAFVAGSLIVSFTHIVTLFGMLGLHGWQAAAAPLYIDGFAMLGLLGRGRRFAAATRKAGLRMQIAATLVSLAANVVAGTSPGGRIFGAMVVIGYVLAERFADQLAPAEADAAAAEADQAADEAAKRSAAAKKGAATRKANAAKVPAQRKARRLASV
jgi:hypothetical protein